MVNQINKNNNKLINSGGGTLQGIFRRKGARHKYYSCSLKFKYNGETHES